MTEGDIESPLVRAPRELTKSQANRRRQLLDAAVTVFAREGYHSARVSDIAAEAGVAHGLVYHYFDSKEAVLRTIFQRTWGHLSQGLQSIVESGESGADQLASVVRLMLGSYRLAPDAVRVLILEVTRSGHLRDQVDEIQHAFSLIEGMIASAQESGEFRNDIAPRLVSYIFWGAIDEVVTAWVFGLLPSDDADVSEAERAVVELIMGGVRADRT